MIRATTTGVLKNYRSGLNKSFTALNKSRDTVLSHRTFNSFAEDPAAAATTFQLRRARMTAESQFSVCNEVYRKYQSAWSSLETVVNDVDNATKNTIKEAALKALNDPTGDARTALGKEMSELADTLVQVMNNKYAENFLFSGADGQTVPFSWGEDGALLYRGIPVDAAAPDVLTVTDGAGQSADVTLMLDANGKYDPAAGTETCLLAGKCALVDYDPDNVPEGALTDAGGNPVVLDAQGKPFADLDALNTAIANGETCSYVTVAEGGTISKADCDQARSDADKLAYLSGEKYFVDVGQGNKENESGALIESSAFDAALQGINFIGYGKDADGDPKNIVSLVKQMANICRSGDGKLSPAEYDELFRLTGKLEDASARLQDMHTDLDSSSYKLRNNIDLLEGQIDSLKEQYSEIEDVDDADAISAFIWAQYSYNAALRVGNSILSQSLMDYLQ